MTMKILAVAVLALSLTACESENANSNENRPAATPAAASPAATTAPVSTAATPAAATQFKAGDKVKVTINGSSSEATIVSVDEKGGKATVKIQGQKEDKTVALSAVSKQ